MPTAVDGFADLADLLPDALILVGADGIVRAVNEAACRLFGRCKTDLRESMLAALVRDQPAAVTSLIRAGSRSKAALPGGLTVVRQTGETTACRCEASVFRPRSDESPALVLLRLTLREAASSRFVLLNERIEQLSREITRRRAAEEALRAATERFRVTLSSIGDAVIATDSAGRVTFMNAMAENMTGWLQEQAQGRHLDDVFVIVNEETRQKVESPVAQVIRFGGTVGLANHTVLIRADGTELPIDDSGAPILDARGVMLGVVLVFHDISERHALEKEIAQKTQRLMEADRRKDEFLSMLAHELRNPLAPLKTGIHLIEHKYGSLAEVTRLAGMMNRQISHMVRLVDDLLDVSRLTRGAIELRKHPFPLVAAVEQAVEMVRPGFEARELTLSVAPVPPDVVVDGDLTRLVQVFSNLLTNAAKFTEPGGTVSISGEYGGDAAHVRVVDTGAGIEPTLLPEIFDLFVQGENTLDRSEGGLGIGLTIVRSIVALHGGLITAHSEGPGRGSEFRITLPLFRAGNVPEPAAPDSASPSDAPASLPVLVVDDNVDAAQTLAEILEMWGHRAHVAHDAQGALDVIAAARPRVALLDIGLPGTNGYELARAIRALPDAHRMVLVAVTGYGDATARQQSAEAGFDGHLTKPVELGMLETLLAAVVSKGG
ncbi:PAS domain S-box protein [Paraburkholderia sediminicola]|uniref:PAS domain-containing hybrid sensor histidine kinase/response regulator n=1 Tax=Paraburkholderia sediminicola TaxID=458836 RepID=UPI0038B86476